MEISPWSKPDHIGVIVKDMDSAVQYYQSFGLGPFEPVTNLHLIYSQQ